MEMIGWLGTALVIVAYFPQIRHLYVEKCAWGISISTWVIWLIAGLLLLTYAWLRSDVLFTVVQIVSIVAITATIILAKRSMTICPYHLEATEKLARAAPRSVGRT
ncbi:MAG: PQ-loop repeat-containing protein [Acidobacteria bacterium]|nr:PQ-loop repeat-containing protein [Acidobacteriota bacterium]